MTSEIKKIEKTATATGYIAGELRRRLTYIDFAGSVEIYGTDTWAAWGTDQTLLSNDQVHPKENGAKQFSLRAILDFPEILSPKNVSGKPPNLQFGERTETYL